VRGSYYDIKISFADFKIVFPAPYGAGSHPVPRMVQGRNDTVSLRGAQAFSIGATKQS